MEKFRKILLGFIIVVFVLGLICVGVGFLTGGDFERIFAVLNSRFHIESTLSLYGSYFERIKDLLLSVF